MTLVLPSRALSRGLAALTSPASGTSRLLCASMGSAGLVVLVTITAEGATHRLGAPSYWPWVLTGLQVTALWGAGAAYWWGWPLGAAMQPPWIAYAVVTGQLGFVPGCLVSCAVQTVTVLRGTGEAGAHGSTTPAPASYPDHVSGTTCRPTHLEVP